MKQYRTYAWIAAGTLLLVVLACNFPTPTPMVLPGTGTGTIMVTETTIPASATPGLLPTNTGTPAATPTEASPVPGEGCEYQAAYVEDVTIPDDTPLKKGEAFVKTWRIRNSGTCDWKEGTRFVYHSESAMGAVTSVAVPATNAGNTVDISVSMTAPNTPGTYRSNWQLETPDKKRFGGVFYVRIVVPSDATPTPTVTLTPAFKAPSNFTGTVGSNCASVIFKWTDGEGETSYRLDASPLSVPLPANTTVFTWTTPATGEYTATLVSLNASGQELGRVTAKMRVVCGNAPDLVVEAITFNPSTPVAFLSLKATVRVKNQGGSAANNFVVQWWGSNTASSPACEWTIASLEAGTSVEKQCDNYMYPSPYASITTKALVDAGSTVAEGNESNNVYEVGTAVASPKLVYDFVEKAPLAYWQSGMPTKDLTWNGEPGDANGFARWATGNLETGAAIQGHCLQTHPQSVENGFIMGTYTDLYDSNYTVQQGDRFYAVVGMLRDANAGNVSYEVMLRAATSGNLTIININDVYGDGLKTISVDLSAYAGQRADVILIVRAGSNADQDWACWLQAMIYRYP
ncbi:MAG: hypothetical protein JXA21_07850 [Anaerolineae bacterium]|nr:hypothetical protein [Anaerolineae bacterium]